MTDRDKTLFAFLDQMTERVQTQIELHKSAGYGLTPMFESHIPVQIRMLRESISTLKEMEVLGREFASLQKFATRASDSLLRLAAWAEIENLKMKKESSNE